MVMTLNRLKRHVQMSKWREGVRGSSASQSNGSDFLGQFSSRQDQAQHQLAPVTPVHVLERGEENEEEQRQKASIRESGTPVPMGAMKGFRLVLFLILLCLQETQVKARETSLVHLEEMEVEADRSRRRRMGTNAEISREDPFLPLTATAADAMRWIAVMWSVERENQKKKKEPGKGSDNLTRKKPGRAPEHLTA